MDGDGTNRHSLVIPGLDGFPDWSPDGKKIAFSNFSSNFQIMVMDADGSNIQNLTNTHSHSDVGPSWQKVGSLPLTAKPPIEPGGPPQSAPPPWSAAPGRR
jgi:Tol biopolymer transport system component